MVKKLIEKEMWRRAVGQREISHNLPNGLVFFAKYFASRMNSGKPNDAIDVATEHTNIFIFFCDCLEMALIPHDVQNILRSIFMDCLMVFTPVLEQDYRMFERYLACYDGASESQFR